MNDFLLELFNLIKKDHPIDKKGVSLSMTDLRKALNKSFLDLVGKKYREEINKIIELKLKEKEGNTKKTELKVETKTETKEEKVSTKTKK